MIFLYDSYGQLLSGKKYRSPGLREKIILDWRRMYSSLFKRCFIQIAPTANALLVGERGENMKRGYGYNIDGKYIKIHSGIKPPRDADMTGANIKAHIYISS